jgi:DNA-binding transcriptional LysR family regulator
LGYTTSAISQQLAVLERETGVPLLERVGRNVRLTPAGHVLVAHANSLLEGVEAAEAELAMVAMGGLSGIVRVAAFQSAFLRIVAPAIRTLAQSHPDIRIEATEAEVEVSTPALQLQHLDLVVGDQYEDQPRVIHPELHREPLLREHINLVVPADHPAARASQPSLSQLADLPWAACQPGTGHHQMHLRVTRQLGGFEPHTPYTSDDFLILLELVRTTGAGALLPDLVLAHDAPGVAARSFAEGAIGREVFLLARQNRSPIVRAVSSALHDAARTALEP